MTWRDVIRAYLHEEDWTQARLAQESGIPASNLSEIMTGKRKPTLRQLERVAAALGTSVSTIIALKERKLPPAHIRTETARLTGKEAFLSPAQARVPILSRCPAGPPETWYEIEDALDAPDAFQEIQPGAEPLYALRVIGDSMNPWMWDGDVAIVDPTQAGRARNGDVVVARVEGFTEEYTIKRVRFQDRHVVLVPDNPNYEAMEYPGARVHIQGLVVKVIHTVGQGHQYDEDLLEFLHRPEVRSFLRSMLQMPQPMWEVLQNVLTQAGPMPRRGPEVYAYLSRVLSQAVSEMGKRFVDEIKKPGET